jgi:PKD repeat protein
LTGIVVRQNAAVEMTDAGATPDIASWDWNFGDNTKGSNAATVTHTWTQVGTFTVVLITTNRAGATGTNTVTVRVVAT